MSGGGRQVLYPLWKYVDRVPRPKGSGGTATIKCKFYNFGWKDTYTRVKAHFLHLPCNGVESCPNECERYDAMREQERADGKVVMRSSHASTTGATNTTYSHDIESEVDVTSRGLATEPAPKRPHIGSANPIGRLFDVQGREAVDAAIGRFFYANGISFNVARCPFYEEMVRAINKAPAGYKPPGYEKLRTTLVDKEKSRLKEQTAPLKRVWAQEGWQEKNTEFFHSQLCDSIEEVGASHVVQVVTDAAPVCKAAGMLVQKRYRQIFWTPCCVHSLNNALKDIGKFQWISNLIEKGRKIQMFICNHHHTQAIYRKFAKVELLKPTNTRFASYFILLDHLCEVKGALCSTVVSDAWAAWKQSALDIVVEVRAMVLDEHFWADVKFVVDFIKPICEVIKFADSDKACLGEVYEAIDSMCERVKKITDAKDISLYPLIEEKLHGRWNKLNTPLHCATYALNPKWYDIEVTKKRAPHQDREVMKGFWAAVKKIYGRGEEASVMRTQWNKFSRGQGDFASVEAIYDMKVKKDPIEWWWNHGSEAPEFSLRLLSRVDPRYNEGPSAKWDQISPDGDVVAIVDEVAEADGLADLPPVILPSEEPKFESDDYLESLIADDLDMDDHGEEE
ncbi:uncharacterized protein LOC131856294 [Cryptomeria japonica]|uniref:uncharacterized protein LOC131856294 n=1 Tax=Cryptomeria japonica TaxID=3369 RepID=UPI0027DAA56C|nr:uncharacterized protein LOC131856294 [Cryptomeria japonica]